MQNGMSVYTLPVSELTNYSEIGLAYQAADAAANKPYFGFMALPLFVSFLLC